MTRDTMLSGVSHGYDLAIDIALEKMRTLRQSAENERAYNGTKADYYDTVIDTYNAVIQTLCEMMH